MGIERQKMLPGELDGEFVAARERARDLCRALNDTVESEQTERRRILLELFGRNNATSLRLSTAALRKGERRP